MGFPSWHRHIISFGQQLKAGKACFLFVSFLWVMVGIQAQPANDNCGDATLISIPANGFAYDSVFSDTVSLLGATTEFGEHFEAGQPNSKSVWFKFSLPTTRQVRILLDQTSNMTPPSAGWTLYSTDNCVPGAGEVVTPYIFNIEGFTHKCLRAGDYLLQVGAVSGANGDIFFNMTLGPSTAQEIPYDYAAAPYDFGVISSPIPHAVAYEVGCQSVFDGELRCPDSTFTKSSWHIFQTDNDVDYIRLELEEDPFNINDPSTRQFGYVLYEGDAQNDSTGLPVIGGCDTLNQSLSGQYASVIYPCLLKPNTTYSIQLLYPTDYFGRITTRLYEQGIGQTQGADPGNLPASHMAGPLSIGTSFVVNDTFSCDALIANYGCGNLAADTIYQSGIPYDLGWWVTFTLNGYETVDMSLLANGQPNPMMFLYQGDITNSCNLVRIDSFFTFRKQSCLPPGTYSILVRGSIHLPAWPANTTSLGKPARLTVTIDPIGQNAFGLFTSSQIEQINSLNPLSSGVVNTSSLNYLDCRTTVLPQANLCNPGNDRAMYRLIHINRPGMLTIGGGNWQHLQYQLFQGNAAQAPVNNGLLGGLSDIAGCQSTYNSFLACLDSGIYTLVTYGNSADVNRADQPWVRFDTLTNQFGLFSSVEVDQVNSLNPLVSGVPDTTTYNRLDCRTTVIPRADSCSGVHDRAMYRLIQIGQDGILTVGGGNYQHLQYQLFRGNAAQAPIVNGMLENLADQACCQNTQSPFKVCVSPGVYTLVTLGNANDLNRGDQPWVRFDAFPPTSFTDTLSVENMDTLSLSGTNPILATATRFDCYDNPDTLLGYAPCFGATKQIYREFYLSAPSALKFEDLSQAFQNNSGFIRHRLFKGRFNQGGLESLIQDCFTNFTLQVCDTLSAGWYTVVTYGGEGGSFNSPTYCGGLGGVIGNETSFRITILTAASTNQFGLFTPTHIDSINNLLPLAPGQSYASTANYFDCQTTLLPASVACSNSNDRAMYRLIRIYVDGILTVGGGNWQNLSYQLYEGNAAASNISAGKLTDLTDLACCQSTYNRFKVCVSPGYYTLVTFGNASDLNRGDQPWVRFDLISPTLFTDSLNPEVLAPLSYSGTTCVTATSTRFDCQNNPDTILGYAPCLGSTKQIYREFYLSDPSSIAFTNHNIPFQNNDGNVRHRIFSGRISQGNLTGLVRDCFTSFSMSTCDFYPAGWYTVVTYDGGGTYSNPAYCNNIGKAIGDETGFSICLLSSGGANQFGLFQPTDVDSINNLNPLVPGTAYRSTLNPFDCRQTFLPEADSCNSGNDRAMYRLISVGQDGILTVWGGNWYHFQYQLFRGNAQTATLNGNLLSALDLVDQVCCQSTYYPFKVCVSPGIYTLVSYGNSGDVNRTDRPWVQLDTFPPTAFTNPLFPENLDTLSLSQTVIVATPTRFDCNNNPDTLLGYAPCSGTTKMVYREFYLSDPSSLDFDDLGSPFVNNNHWVRHRIFQGRVSTNSLSSLIRDCFVNFDMGTCELYQPGWYTVVSYGGRTHLCGMQGTEIGDVTSFRIELNPTYPQPQFNTFAKAEQVNSGLGISWRPQPAQGHTASTPKQDTTYILGTEYFGCFDDLPFPTGITPCDTSYNRISYRVFQLDKASMVFMSGFNPYPYGYNTRLYQGDITQNTAPYSVIHDCFGDKMRMCLDPGVYTLVTFAKDMHIGYSLTPRIYLDSLGVSKYNDAAHAYDFGNVPLDGVQYLAAPGSSPDALGRPGSNDFIFCSTDAQPTDPSDVCYIGNTSLPYGGNHPLSPRQNLWYTLETTGPGNLEISVYPLTPGKTTRLPFAVYLVSNNTYPLTDSTSADLTLIARSSNNCSYHAQSVTIFRDPCAVSTSDRYVVLVDRHAYNTTDPYLPNMQVQVGARFSALPPSVVQYDHYSQANVINGNPTTSCSAPYQLGPLSVGTYTGCEGNLTCATKDATDQNACGLKTIWYKFEVAGSGRLRLNYTRTDNGQTGYHANDIQLYREIVPFDSTSAGLQRIPLISTGQLSGNPSLPGSFSWGQTCYSSGVYYVMITGCNFPSATVYPRIWLEEFPGDYCQDSIQVNIPSPGIFLDTAVVDCWTIGDGPGENSVSSMGCLGDPIGLKSGWFHIAISDTQKMDLNIELFENTSASGLNVRYRIGNGSCQGMNFENCVDDIRRILNLKCRQDSGIWIQVTLPANDTGKVILKVEAVPSPDQNCQPPGYGPRARFDFGHACAGEVVNFINNSTLGANYNFKWNFGDPPFTSTLFAPTHVYPQSGTYTVILYMYEGAQLVDSNSRQIFIYPIPNIGIVAPSQVYAGDVVSISQNSTNTIASATYYWTICRDSSGYNLCKAFSGGSIPPQVFNKPGIYEVCLTVANGACARTLCDSIAVKFRNFYVGGPYDGADKRDSIGCQSFNFYVGGPYDGADKRDSIPCQSFNFFVGGPYDGVDRKDSIPCQSFNFFVGGPYDGADRKDSIPCQTFNFYVGGPYDGVDRKDCAFCQAFNFYVGGPYDGADENMDLQACMDTMQSIWSGGSYDGFGHFLKEVNCNVYSIWNGGPYDGAAMGEENSDCPRFNFYVGGPHDGADRKDSMDCQTFNFYVGGPYDGVDRRDSASCEQFNFFVGGPYDGADRRDSANCEQFNFYVGGPYDGADRRDSANCEQFNFFVGGPYDGVDRRDSSICDKYNFYVGGPYDGADRDGSGMISAPWITICEGDPAVFTTSSPTNWYAQPTGGTPFLTNVSTHIISKLIDPIFIYVDDVCGGVERVPIVAHVIDTLDLSFEDTVNCVGIPGYFSATSLTPGPSIATIGTELTSFAASGTSPNLRQLSFSSGSGLSFSNLHDGSAAANAWTYANTGPSTVWVQWNYFQAMSVDRIDFWESGNDPSKYPQLARLYFANSQGWNLVKVFSKDELSSSQFSSGLICESAGNYSQRWKLELDMDAASSPVWSEFQVYANQLSSNGNVQWDFGDNSPPAFGGSVGHSYQAPGTYTVTMSAFSNCPCPSAVSKTITVVDTCQPLPLLEQTLSGNWAKGPAASLNWWVSGHFEMATLQKYLNGHWMDLETVANENLPIYTFLDPEAQYEFANLYRMKTYDGASNHYSNVVELRLDLAERELVIYPNPVTEGIVNLKVVLPHTTQIRADLYNIHGQLIRPLLSDRMEGVKTYSFTTHDLTSGMYFVHIWIDGGVVVRKLEVVW